jgi:DNA mismatch repair protein MutS
MEKKITGKQEQHVWKKYIDFQNKYDKIYDKCICLIQAGGFYEIYSTTDDGYIDEACKVMEISVGRKNIEGCPYFGGVPDHSIKKFLYKLIRKNYTIVIIDHVGPKNSKGGYDRHEVSKILDRSNVDIFFDIDDNCEDKNDTNNLLSIYIEEEKTLHGNNVISVGLSVIDLTTGINHIHEIVSKNTNIFEEMYRFIESHNPIEIILHTKNLKTYTKDDLINKINTNDKSLFYNFYDDKTIYFKLSYQQDFLKKIFPNTGMLNAIQYLDLQYRPYALNSYILLLQFSYEHESNIINKIREPLIYDSTKNLNLYNNALYQLDIVQSNIIKNRFPSKFRSLFDVINQTSTLIGKRELKNRLLNPITNIEELQRRYNLVENMFDKIDRYENSLSNILDIEKYHRKLSLKILLPREYAKISYTYQNILDIIKLYETDFMPLFGIDIDYNDIEKYKKYFAEYKQIFNVDVMIKYGIKHIEESFFNLGIHTDIDDIQYNINICNTFFDNIISEYSIYVDEYEKKNKKTSKKESKKIITLSYQEKQGNKQGDTKDGEYCLIMKKRQGDILKEIMKQKNITNYRFESHNKSDVKLASDQIKKMSNDLVKYINLMDEKVRIKYKEYLDYFDEKYNFNNIAKFVGEIDVIKSCAKVAKMYGYCKPNIYDIDNERSFIDGVDVRHPIVERLQIATTYIPNDVKLSEKEENIDGMLLYSQNSCGKSCYMKSVGLNIILAQIGSYVAAKTFNFYPYNHIFTRISGDDNIFYGQSSFAIEMIELSSILKFANKNSLVLGDEVCRGTETISGIALVSSAINKFCKNNINFIFATHLHKLYELDCIKDLKNLGIYHLTINTSNGKLVYERKLEKGPGDSIYGLEIAKHMIKDDEFINFAFKVRNDLLNIPEHIIQPKYSKYNSEIYIDKCQIIECNKTYKDEQLDVHHILFQSHCDDNGMVEHVKKNDKNNLVVLCKNHHIQVHNKNLEIYGYLFTEDGKILNYKFVDCIKKNKLKFDNNDITIIKSYKDYPIQYIIDKLNNDHNIKISITTLNKIYNNEY